MWIAFCEECGCQYTFNPDEIVRELLTVKCKKCNSFFEVRGGVRSGDDQVEKRIGFKPVVEYTPQIPINPSPSLSSSPMGQFAECSSEDLTFEDRVLKAISAAIPASLKDDEVSLHEIGALVSNHRQSRWLGFVNRSKRYSEKIL